MRRQGYYLLFGIIYVLTNFSACQDREKIFQIVLPVDSGIDFQNNLETNDTINGIYFEYVYNGAGLAVGDVNNDGLNDIFFAGNMVSSRLYLNLGNLKFKDITSEAGISTNQWCTGTSIVDINSDGLADIYICVAGLGPSEVRKNIFFIHQGLDNNGIPRYRNLASEMGLDDDGYSTMAAFFDYDQDQDLDVYVLTNAMEARLRNALRPRRINGEGPSTDRFYRNDGQGIFTDVSEEAGILQEGYGLGIGISDINQDGWMDVYCANDFLSNDLLWINNQDGSFSEESGKYFKHFTSNGMGMDMADYNNDGLLDVVVLDMLPNINQRQKQMIGYRNLTRFYESLVLGYHPQYLRNTLQLNRGKFEDGNYRFSEIGYLAEIHQTDWSWSPLIADFDNDGWKDLSITNGYRKDVTNLDYIQFTLRDNAIFGTPESKKERALSAMNGLPEVKLNNFIFRNNRNLTFTDKSKDWGWDYPTFTNGTAYADLDNDGDLDVVVNNIDQETIIYKNLISEKEKHHYLKLIFSPQTPDYERIGLKAWTYHDTNMQFHEYAPYRGYKSTVGTEIIIGLGNSTMVDSLRIQWPDGRWEKWSELKSDTTILLNSVSAKLIPGERTISQQNVSDSTLKFKDQTAKYRINIKHNESSGIDLNRIPIILHNLGQYGPGIAVGDINNDGLDDLYVGSDQNAYGNFIIQQGDGTIKQILFCQDSLYEDLGAIFLDVDGDKDQDLYIVSGGSDWNEYDEKYQDRLYLNDGDGDFIRSLGSLPEIRSSGSCVIASDYDLDGDLDLFVGSRHTPNKYPSTPQSYLLENTNGTLKDVSMKLGNEKGFLGMVTSALWTDLNNDLRPDLIVVGEYMPITILINQENGFVNKTASYGLENTNGWWNSINGADIDNDGDIDYVLGNYGLNSYFKPTVKQPVEIFASDFDNSGTFDPITTVYIQDQSYIFHPRNLMIDQIPNFNRRFKTFEKYGITPFNRSFTKEEIENSIHFQCKMLRSIVLENVNGHSFKIHHLPIEAQFSPVFGSTFNDFNNDGLIDLLLTGNSYAEETIYGYYDASYGTFLLNEGNFSWKFVENNSINLVADGNKKALSRVFIGDKTSFFLTENNGTLQILDVTDEIPGKLITIRDDEWYATIIFKDGSSRKVEFYYGNGYLSQNSRKFLINDLVESVQITKYNGESRILNNPILAAY